MTWLDRFFWFVFLIPPPLVPALAWAQPAEDPNEIVVVQDGTPAPVAPADVADRLRAELPGASVRLAAPGEASGAGTVTVALTPEGTLQVVYRDAAGREATRIIADTHDPSAVAAAVAMIVANLHRSQLDSVLGAPQPANVPAPVPVPEPPAPPPPSPPVNVPVPDRQASPPTTAAPPVRLVAPAAPQWSPGWVFDAGGLYAVVAASAMVSLGYDLSPVTRVGLGGNFAYVPDAGSTAFTLDVFYTRLGRSRPGRLDVGAQGGLLAVDDGETLGFHAGPFAAYLYALTPRVSIGARLGVDVALIDGDATIWPTAAIFCELPI